MATKAEKPTALNPEATEEETEDVSVYERSTLELNAVYDQSDSGKAIKNSGGNEESSAEEQDAEMAIQSAATESSRPTTAPIQHNILGTVDLVTDSEEDDVDHLIDLMDKPDETPKRMPVPFMEPSKKM